MALSKRGNGTHLIGKTERLIDIRKKKPEQITEQIIKVKLSLTDYLRQRVALQVQQHRSRLETRPQLKKTMQGQCGHVWFAPPLSSLLHLLFKLHPPVGNKTNTRTQTEKGQVRNTQLLWHFSSAGGAHSSGDVWFELAAPGHDAV